MAPLVLEEVTAPSKVPPNTLKIYAKDSSGVSALFYKDDGLTEHEIADAADLPHTLLNAAGIATQLRTRVSFSSSGKALDTSPVLRYGLAHRKGRLKILIDDLEVSVFGGLVFASDDRQFRGVKIPREYWKVLAFVERGELKARGFLLTQGLEQLEALELDELRVFQVHLTEIEQRALLSFPQVLRDADLSVAPEAIPRPLDSLR